MLRVRIPQPLFLCDHSEDGLKVVSVSFSYHSYAMTLTFDGGDVKKQLGLSQAASLSGTAKRRTPG
jgi:hypothetical protein